MKPPPVDRLVASVSRPVVAGVPYEWEYQLWFQLARFPILVKVRAA